MLHNVLVALERVLGAGFTQLFRKTHGLTLVAEGSKFKRHPVYHGPRTAWLLTGFTAEFVEKRTDRILILCGAQRLSSGFTLAIIKALLSAVNRAG